MIRSRLNAHSIDMHHEALTACDWAQLAACASDRADLARKSGDSDLAVREEETENSHYYDRYLLWPLSY
jgi:hypothetical protein